MEAENIKAKAQELIESLPEDASWEDLMKRIYIRQTIDEGFRDSEEGNTLSVEEVRKRFNLEP